MRRTILILTSMLATASACGDDDPADTEAATSEGSGPDSVTGASTDGASETGASTAGTGGSVGTAGTADSTDTEPLDCVEDEPPAGPEVTITLRNERAEAIFVTAPFFCADAHLRIDSNGMPPGQWPLGACTPRCTSIVADMCECPEVCEIPSLVRIEPGASHEIAWDGALFVEHLLDPVCNACGVAPDCRLGVSAPEGMVLVSATAASAASECTDAKGAPVACECAADEGSCMLDGTVADPQELGAQALLEYPGTTALELVFEAS
jgi:hypothetical protein